MLGALAGARAVDELVGIDPTKIVELYPGIHDALIGAVNAVHVPWKTIPHESLLKIHSALRRYTSIYTTNYDLLVYWALMSASPEERFKDYFWDGSFDLTNLGVTSSSTRILYLHGALHLYRAPNGKTFKRRSDTSNLLELFRSPEEEGVPLFITEGTAEDKREAIGRCDYLTFAHIEFARHTGGLVVFGHSLGPSDQHLVTAMRHWYKGRQIAVSLRKANERDIITRKAAIVNRLPDAHIDFFDAETHPLGDPALAIATRDEP